MDSDQSQSERDAVTGFFSPLFAGTGGIDSWLNTNAPDGVFARLEAIPKPALSRAQLNQLLVLSNEAGVSAGFFRYYWTEAPTNHPYDVKKVEGFDSSWLAVSDIRSLNQLRWGLYRLYIDALLYFGSIRSAYRFLRDLTEEELRSFFTAKRYDTVAMQQRGPAMPLRQIARDNRYLISEMACKSYDAQPDGLADLLSALLASYRHQLDSGHSGDLRIRDLLEGSFAKETFADRHQQLQFSADDLLDERISSEDELQEKYAKVAELFLLAREAALENTRLYLSDIEQLDVYVATSMRTRQDFREMADFCESVFGHQKLRTLNIRYFDPTLSAADGHEDKGLIECLMVKSAKVLVYFAGARESYGKDAEAAMALSLGKPVIFYCDNEQREKFYREVHPLSRLIHFETGVPVGAMVASTKSEVVDLVNRIFRNRLDYRVEQPKPGRLRLVESISRSVVRLQTSDELLRETFWNYYNHEHRTAASAGV